MGFKTKASKERTQKVLGLKIKTKRSQREEVGVLTEDTRKNEIHIANRENKYKEIKGENVFCLWVGINESEDLL